MTTLSIEHFTDPACPFAFSAEPVRMRLRWHYGEQLVWRDRMIVLTHGDPEEAERLASGAPGLQRRYGMPIDPAPRPRPASSEPACRAVVAARLFASERQAERLLRRLRLRAMGGGLLDDPELIEGAVAEAGLSPSTMAEWARRDEVGRALEEDIQAARSPTAEVRAALSHKLKVSDDGLARYSAPSYVISSGEGGRAFVIPGFNPVEAYETAVANLAPELRRRAAPGSVEEVLEWAGEPLATAEIALIAQMDPVSVRARLARVARAEPSGADFLWTLA